MMTRRHSSTVRAVRYYLFIWYKYAASWWRCELGTASRRCRWPLRHGDGRPSSLHRVARAVATNRSGEKARARTDINIEGSGSIKRRNEFQARRTKMAGSKTLWIPSNILTVRLPIAALKSDGRRARQFVFNIKMTMIIY